jgi:hypothetical protein
VQATLLALCQQTPHQPPEHKAVAIGPLRFNRRFYPFNAFHSLLGIAGDVTAV